MNFFIGIFQGFWPKISKNIIQNTDSHNSYKRFFYISISKIELSLSDA